MKQLLILLIISLSFGQKQTPAEFWSKYDQKEKVAFINGVYGTISTLKTHHQQEVKRQFTHDKNWVAPFYIERFYTIADEYRAEEIGYDLKIVVLHMDAFYVNSDNYNIPVMEALRIVSLMQDGERKKANLRLLKAQRKYIKM